MSVFTFWPTVRISTIGDSLTLGDNETSYQYHLLHKLQAHARGRVHFLFVGAQNQSTSPIHVDGYSGKRIDELTPGTYLTNYPADVCVVHAGTNDIIQDATGATCASRMVSFLTSLFAVSPTIQVVLCKITPISTNAAQYTSARAAALADYNSRLTRDWLRDNHPSRHVMIVDCHTGFPTDGSYQSDGLHQNAAGAEFMADAMCGPAVSWKRAFWSWDDTPGTDD